jgi:hypothetical protein
MPWSASHWRCLPVQVLQRAGPPLRFDAHGEHGKMVIQGFISSGAEVPGPGLVVIVRFFCLF